MYLKSTKFEPKNMLLALFFALTVFTGSLKAQLTGTLNIPGDYATLSAAITALNSSGVGTVNVTLNVIAGNPQTAPLGGYSITATGAGTNQIIINGNSNIITAPTPQTSGLLNDAFFKIIGGDYITITGFNMQENAANTATTAGTNNMTEFGVSLTYSTATDGAQNVSIISNTIILNRAYQNTFGIYSNSTHNSIAYTTASSATSPLGANSNLSIYSNTISNVNIGIVIVGPTAAANYNNGLDIGGSSILLGNTISNYGTTGVFSGYSNVSGTVNGILVRNTNNYNISYNTISSSNGGHLTGANIRGIFIPAFTVIPTLDALNSITNNTISIRSGLLSATHLGISVEATTGTSTSSLSINNNNFNTFGHTVAGSGTISFILNSLPCLITNINGNTFSNISVNTTGSLNFISNNFTKPVNAITSVNSNSIIGTFSKTGSGGTVYFYDNFGSSTSSVTEHNINNNFSNLTFTGATTIGGWRTADGGTPGPRKTISNNIFSNITAGTNAVTILNASYSDTTFIANNIINNNSISNISSAGAITGILSVSGHQNITQNNISGILSSGASVVTGISITGGATQNIFKNKIYDISGSNASSIVSGIIVSSGTTNNIYNNIIGDLRTPVANAANPLIGISITGGTTNKIYYNTVQLNGISSGTNFGSSAISTNATPTTIEVRNNIFVNNSTSNGTGFSVAYRRSAAALTNYASTSNNNLLFAKTIFYDGTTTYTTLASYKAAVTPRESASFEENPNFASLTGSNANFLHFSTNTTTFAESGAINITSFTDDFDNDVRQGNLGYAGLGTSPDIGADEFEGKIPSCFSPTNLTTSNITTTSVDLTWTAPISGTPASYNGEIRISGAPGSGTLGLVSAGTIPVPTTTASVPGLTALTAYSVYIQSDCGAGDLSSWSPVTTFTTLADCRVPSALNSTTVLATSANFTWTAGGTETAWDIYYGAQPLTVPTATTAPTATSSVASYSATGLTQVTAYSVYVRANCGAGNSSVWTAVKNFTTPISCPAPSIVTISGITPTTADATWLAGGSETSWLVNYIAPTTTVITASPAYSLTGLAPSTTYSIQVKAICAVGDSSMWSVFTAFTTPCLPPSILITTPSTRCGAGTTTLSATGDVGATLNWYANSTGGVSVGTGTLFTTPTITATTDFYVSAGNVYSGSKTLGNGGTTGTSAAYNLTNGTYGGLKGQYLFTAAELSSAGIAAGNITSMAFDLTSTGAILNGFAVEVGTTTLTTFGSSNIEGGLTSVYPATSFTPAIGSNVINFATPFNWNGTSNIIVSVSWSNNNTSNTSSTIKYDATSNFASLTYRKDSETASNMAAFTGSIGTGISTFDRTQNRPKFTFSGNVMCEGPRNAVTASVTGPPVLTVTSGSTICANAIQTLSVTSTLSDFDNYVWTPNTNLFIDGGATTAYTGNNQSALYYSSPLNNNTTYTLTATNTLNGCANNTTVSMGASMPVIYASANPTLLCSGSTVSLTANTDMIATGTVAIGTGTLVTTGSNGSGGNYVSPYSHYFGGYKSQYIIRASELQSAGVSSGNITSLSFDVTSAGTTYTNFAISMAATTQSAATTAFNGSVSQVYGPSNVTPILGLNAYTFSTPFNWDGVSNITIQICWSNNNTGGGGAAEIKYNTTTFASTSYYRVDSQNSSFVCGQTTATGTFNNRPNIILAGQTVSQGAGTVTWQWNAGAINSNTAVVNPVNTGTTTTTESYTVTALDPATTCTNSAVVNFSVSPLPTVIATASSASVCAGSSATLTASGATNYTWTAAGTASTQVVTLSSASVYTVTGETSGCSNTTTVSVGVNPIPTVSVSASNTLVCSNIGESSTLTASTSATSYTWSTTENTSVITVTPSVGTTYSLTVSDGTCEATATVFVDAQVCSGVKELVANGISVYPNPTNGIVNISISSELAGNTSIEVYDAIGKLTIKENLTSNTTTINTSKLVDGIYVYKIMNNNTAIKIGKIVKQ